MNSLTTVHTNSNVAHVKAVIEMDRCLSVMQVIAETKLNRTGSTTSTKDLGSVKRCARWIPKF